LADHLWWGGHSYGPRLFSEVIPYLLYFLIPSIRQLTAPITTRRVPLVALFALFAGLSFFIHFRGATEPAAAFGWNWQYAEVIAQVNDDPARLWDWSDPPFLRGLRPAVLHVTPQSLSFQVRKGVTSAQVSGLVVANLGDKDLAWRAKAPQGIILSSPGQDGKFLDQQTLSRLPPGSTAQPLVMTIDLEGYRPGIHSLGAILVSAGSIDGKPLLSSPIAIPITLEIQPASSQQTRYAPLSDPYLAFMPLVSGGHSVLVAAPPDIVLPVAPPPDILLNGAAQSLAEDRIQAFYGAGWYALERLDAYSWRWTKSPAEIYIHSRSRRTIRLESKPVALYEPGALRGMGDHGTLKVTTNQQDSVEIAVQREQVFGVDLALASGWNVITLESQAGNMRPADLDPGNGDLRQLSFALDVVNLTEE
jgi:hypothetical protein